MATRMKSKFDKYWGNSNHLLSIAAVLNPRFKFKLIDFAYKSIYNELEAQNQKIILRDSLEALFREYLEAYKAVNYQSSAAASELGSEQNIRSESSTRAKGKNPAPGVKQFMDALSSEGAEDNDIKSELDVYLEEGVLKLQSEEEFAEFDAIHWWKSYNLKFRVLSKMAVELLSIPITTVASESTFSAGGRIIDQYRSSLGTESVQVLLCGNDWFRGFYGLKKKGRVSILISSFYLCIH